MANVKKVAFGGSHACGKNTPAKLITICRLLMEYPALMIVITDNLCFQNGRWTTKDIDEALKQIKKWMKENLRAKPKSKK